MAIDKLPGTAIATDAITADQLATGSITVADIPTGEITADKLHTTLNLSSKTITLPAASVTAHAASALNDLSDVNTSGVANGKILKYNGSAWVIADDAGGPADTDALSEGSSNLYYTTARANSAIDSRVNASFINNLTIVADTATTLATGRTISGVTFDGSQNITLNTSAITENTNLYYTDARVKASTLTAGSLRGSVNNATVQYGSSYSGTPAQGSFFFDSLNAKLKVYDGSAFLDAVPAGGGGGGGGSTDANTTFRKYLYTIGSVGNAVSGKDDVIVTAGSFVTGYVYIIVSAGNTDFTAIGSANNTVGTQFTATGAGSGTGTASHKLNYVTDGTENVEVYVNGIKQIQGSANDYVATSGTTVNFVSNLAVNDEVEVNVFELLTNTSNFASLTVDTSTLVVNGTTNRVGIGTATPFTRAVVGGGSGTEVLTIFSGSSGEGQIRFADATSGTGSYQGRVEYDHANSKLNLGAGGTTPFTIDSSGNVGIGTGSPDQKMHLYTSSGTTLYKAEVNANSTVGLEIKKTGSTTQSWRIVDGQTVNGALQFYDVTDSRVSMQIDGSGRLLVGKTSSNYATEGVEIRSNEILITKAGTNPLSVRNNGDGGLISLNRAGVSVGNIGVRGGTSLYIESTASTRTGLDFSGAILPRYAGGLDSSDQTDLGASSYQFKDIYLSNRVKLGASGGIEFGHSTSSASGVGVNSTLLDHYEEGTFTPVLSWYTPSNGSVSYIARTAYYIRVGRAVTIHLEMRLNIVSQNSASLPLLVSGFPYPFRNTGGYGGSLMQVSLQGFTFSSGHIPFGWGEYNSDRMFLFTMASGAANTNLPTPPNYKTINVSGTYITPQ